MNRDRFHSQNLELEAERGVLGSIMLDDAVLREVIVFSLTWPAASHTRRMADITPKSSGPSR